MRRGSFWWILFYVGIMAVVASLLTLMCARAFSDELPPPPRGTIERIDGKDLICYDEENARLIAHYVQVLAPMQQKRILLLEGDRRLLEEDSRLLRQQIWNLELSVRSSDDYVAGLEVAAQLAHDDLVRAREDWELKRKLHWVAHGAGIVALAVSSALIIYERNE